MKSINKGKRTTKEVTNCSTYFSTPSFYSHKYTHWKDTGYRPGQNPSSSKERVQCKRIGVNPVVVGLTVPRYRRSPRRRRIHHPRRRYKSIYEYDHTSKSNHRTTTYSQLKNDANDTYYDSTTIQQQTYIIR